MLNFFNKKHAGLVFFGLGILLIIIGIIHYYMIAEYTNDFYFGSALIAFSVPISISSLIVYLVLLNTKNAKPKYSDLNLVSYYIITLSAFFALFFAVDGIFILYIFVQPVILIIPIILAIIHRERMKNVNNTTEFILTNNYEQLKKLNELRLSGILTDDEFQREKEKILGGN